MENIAKHIKVTGLVQGVGFRPFIYRQASRMGLKGWVRNHTGGVEIHIEGTEDSCKKFMDVLVSNAPEASAITGLEDTSVPVKMFSAFEIKPSLNGTERITNISPDIAVCPGCLKDIKKQPRRLNYPFTNCTHCGPRFSIVRDIPYDRQNTSMKLFEMCPECRKEYENITDRRFHAQPVSCMHCGPQYQWTTKDNKESCFSRILQNLSSALSQGKIIAIKGTGGFHLICDAKNEASVRRLRKIKQRQSKPFAVMFRNLNTLKDYARVNSSQELLLRSWRRPIVILDSIYPPSEEVNRGFTTLGAILPYTPFHYLLMENIHTPAIVFSSANLKAQPLISDNKTALKLLESSSCDAVVSHDRAIQNKQDDSIIMEKAGTPVIVRRARGFVPEPVSLDIPVEGILAMGADLKNAFCTGKDYRAIMSQYIGDLEDFDVFMHFQTTINNFKKLFRVTPHSIAIDTHPQYHSSRYGKKLAREHPHAGLIPVQHHHAHIASVLAEHGLDENVIGIAMDGTGFGDDGKIWGSEFLICDLQHYQRLYHLAYIPLQGGEKAIRQPWRTAVAAMHQALGEEYLNLPLLFHQYVDISKQRMLIKALNQRLNIHESCGMGRLFDVVAALVNLVHIADFDGEGPVKLENIHTHDTEAYHLPFYNGEYRYEPLIRSVVKDLLDHFAPEIISGRFHNAVVEMICDGAERTAAKSGLKKVALSGGIFQNRIITEKVQARLSRKGFSVYMNHKVPCNDGGIALGQLAITGKKTKNICV
ncbi:MAG: carbamoyltransferase HypF [Bacteroidales bacterium]|nr:carbamoyltransferase HypF [Bacteroidales bacterium]